MKEQTKSYSGLIKTRLLNPVFLLIRVFKGKLSHSSNCHICFFLFFFFFKLQWLKRNSLYHFFWIQAFNQHLVSIETLHATYAYVNLLCFIHAPGRTTEVVSAVKQVTRHSQLYHSMEFFTLVFLIILCIVV